jgi:pimeloyl-ACP methyl ester carboxylesterase
MDLTVLALHGLTSTTKVWSGLAAALPQARIVAPDLAGRGSAAERRTAPGLSGHADDVVRWPTNWDSTAASHRNGPYWSVVRSYARCSGLRCGRDYRA